MNLLDELKALLAKAVGDAPYGDVTYADPGHQPDGQKRYPIDSEAHIRAAWNYIHKPHNADQYSAGDLASVKARIVEAWKHKIDPAGPPEAAQKSVLLKSDDADRMVYGFASVSVAKGADVVDSHKHEITTKAIRKLMHGVIAGQRAGKLLHKGGKQTDIVESIVLEPNLWKALGAYLQDIGEITADQAQVFKTITFEGALVGFHVGDDSLWKLAQETDFELSIGVEEATLMEVK